MDNGIDLSTGALVFVIGLLVLAVLIIMPRAKQLWQTFSEKYPKESAFLTEQGLIAIDGAEQEFGKDGEGARKIEAAIVFVEKQAERYGYSFDPYVIKMVIHALLKKKKEQSVIGTGQK